MECQKDLWKNEDEPTICYLTLTSGRTKAVKNVQQHQSKLSFLFMLLIWQDGANALMLDLLL